MNIGDRTHGFIVTDIKDSSELGGRLHYLTHEKLGTELLWLDNDESNKLFCIAFKTVPVDSTGVFHILEHSVLCGSDKYPLKEPFVDLLKSSMNTFLNAMTYPDKTMYPVSSRNSKDFLNLTSVYLDAVFAPAILHNPNIFYQEGWHVEQDENGKLSYKGVVFNEMKGAMSRKEGLIEERLISLLYPDNCYGVNSGGDPENIPDLTHEQFIESYKRFYHPSNARIYLDGAVPLEETLALIEEYLVRYERRTDLPEIAIQTPISREKTICYAVGEEEDLKDKTDIVLAKVFTNWDNPVKTFAASILFNALADSNDSVFKKAVLESGLAQDLDATVSDEISQAFYSIELSNVKDGKAEEVITLIKNVAKEQVEKGIDRKALIASINSLEFKVKAPTEPAGLIRCTHAMESWLYGGDPIMYLEFNEYFKQLRAMLEDDSYEKLLAELLSDEGLCTMTCIPSKTLTKEQDAKEAQRLAKVAEGWSQDDRAANLEMNKKLQAWQQTPDSQEAQAAIPVLPLSDVSEEPFYTETIVSELCGATQLYHPVNTHGIVHMELYFNIADVSIENLVPLSELGGILSFIPTKRHSTLELEQEIKTYLGDLSFKLSVHARKDQKTKATPVLTVSCSVLEENLQHAYDLIYEVLTETVFVKNDIENIIKQDYLKLKQLPAASGHSFGQCVASASYTASNAVREALGGYSAIKWLHDTADNFDAKSDEIIALYEKTLCEACCTSRLTISITNTEPVDVSEFVSRFNEGSPAPDASEYKPLIPGRMGIKIPAMVGFAVQAGDLSALGEDYDGSIAVASRILSLDYFWNMVRVQGGAYGSGLKAGISGNMFTYSYRDPSPKRSIDINLGAGDYLRKYCEEKGEISKYIISTIAETEPLFPPRARGVMATADYFSGYSYEDLKAQRKQMLGTDYDKLIKAAKLVDRFAKEGEICVIGSEEKLAEFQELNIREI